MEFHFEPPILQGMGPVIATNVGIAEEHAELLRQEGLSIPQPVIFPRKSGHNEELVGV
jgi:hypothetical protein